MSDLAEAYRWLQPAVSDLETADDNAENHPNAACFFAQQAAEKALKSIAVATGLGHLRLPGIGELRNQIPGLGDMVSAEDAAALDLFHIPTRYPDALPGGIPGRAFTRQQAIEAIGRSRRVLAVASALLPQLDEGREQ